MTTFADVLPFLAVRAEEVASSLFAFAVDARTAPARDHEARRRALVIARRARALAAAVGFAEGDEALAVAMELTQIEEAADAILVAELETVRPPPSMSGTFVVERRNASTNRLLAVRGGRAS